jgi:hypothetical protein
VHHLVAAYLGYKAPVHTPAQAVTDIDDFLMELGAVQVRKVAALDSTEFDRHMKDLKNG